MPETGSFRMVGVEESNFLAYIDSTLLFSYHNGVEFGTRDLNACSLRRNSSSSKIETDVIKDLAVSSAGEIAVLTAANNVLYGKIGLKDTIFLEELYHVDSMHTAIWFDGYNRLHLLISSESGLVNQNGNVGAAITATKSVPIYHAIQSMFGFDLRCPYHSFDHTLSNVIYWLDMGEKQTFTVHVVHQGRKRKVIRKRFRSTATLKITTEAASDYTTDFVSEQETVTVRHEYDFSTITGPAYYAALWYHSSQTGTLDVGPADINLACDSPTSAVRLIFPGCPPGRHIRIREGTFFSDCATKWDSYFIPAGSSRDLATGDTVLETREIPYPSDGFECPYLASRHGTVHPIIDIWEGDTFVKVGDEANFVLFEEMGRTDFGYTRTMEEVGCLHRAQTWEAQLAQAREAGTPLADARDIWGPHNYQSCYSDDRTGNAFHQDEGHSHPEESVHCPYEILNNSGLNQITLPRMESSLYVFQLVVVDPNYSYCNLSIRFAIRVYGTLPPRDLNDVAIVNYSMAILIGSLLVMTYLYYHRASVRKINLEQRARDMVSATTML